MTQGLRCGFVLPGGDLRDQVDLAVLAQERGWDGIFTRRGEDGAPSRPTPADIADVVAWLVEQGRPGMDVIVDGQTPAGDPAAAVALTGLYADAGATWWLETRWSEGPLTQQGMAAVRERLEAGPPRPGS